MTIAAYSITVHDMTDEPMRNDGDGATSSTLDAGEQRAWLARAVRRTGPDWSLERSIGAIDRLTRAVANHVGDGVGGLAELTSLVELERSVRDVVDGMARHLLESDDYSYREIGVALGMTRQAVEQRYPGASSRPAGAQSGNLR